MPESKQRWALGPQDIGVPHPNTGKPWAFRGGATRPPPTQTQPPPTPTQPLPPPTPERLDADLDEAVDANEGWLAPGLSELISDGLVYVAASIPSGAPGVPPSIIKGSTTAAICRLSSHAMFNAVADVVAVVFADRWKSETRADLIRDIDGQIPDLAGYYIKHMVRSLAYVFSLDEIPCYNEWYGMTDHTKDAVNILENGKIKPSGVVDYMRRDGDIGIVDSRILPGDDMSLTLAICQAKSVWDLITVARRLCMT